MQQPSGLHLDMHKSDYSKLLANTWRQGSTAAIACNCSQSLAHHPFQRSRALHARGHLLQGMQQHVARHLQSCVSQTSSAFTSGICPIGHRYAAGLERLSEQYRIHFLLRLRTCQGFRMTQHPNVTAAAYSSLMGCQNATHLLAGALVMLCWSARAMVATL